MSSTDPERKQTPGMGAQSRGSRKGLGGDQPNHLVEGTRRKDPVSHHAKTKDELDGKKAAAKEP